ncbi:pyridoxamine 5'-phosphate oxidase family protein [Nonomuraea indica]|uniref:Pyridoxamine 5'-phosphate oxidase family protein n=1 Tax=Nonomuraea indica TaxID=1581193 RepID=A0ABW8AAQ7_9ACTN
MTAFGRTPSRGGPPAGAAETFLAEPHVATLTTLRPDGSPHVAPVRFTWDGDAGLVRVLTVAASRKARNLTAAPDGGRVALCQVTGPRWITFEGTAAVRADQGRVAEVARRYAERYGSPPPAPPGRVVIEIAVDRIMHLNT